MSKPIPFGGHTPWAVFVVIRLRNREDAKHLRCLEEPFGFFSFLMVLLDHLDSPSGDRQQGGRRRTRMRMRSSRGERVTLIIRKKRGNR